MKWRIHYNTCFYSEVIAESEKEAVEKAEKVLNLEDIFRLTHVEAIEERLHLEDKFLEDKLYC